MLRNCIAYMYILKPVDKLWEEGLNYEKNIKLARVERCFHQSTLSFPLLYTAGLWHYSIGVFWWLLSKYIIISLNG